MYKAYQNVTYLLVVKIASLEKLLTHLWGSPNFHHVVCFNISLYYLLQRYTYLPPGYLGTSTL